MVSREKNKKTQNIILVLPVYLPGPHRDQIFCQCWCRRNIKYTEGTGSLLLSPASFWVVLTGMLDRIPIEMSVKVPASVRKVSLNRRGHYVSMIWWVRAAQRLVCFETKPLFELLHSSQLASLPVRYKVMTDVRYVSSNFPELSFREQCQSAELLPSLLLATSCDRSALPCWLCWLSCCSSLL